MRGIDVAEDTTGRAHDLQAAGIRAVGLYLRLDRTSKAMVDGLAAVGLKRFSIYEKGHPDHAGYFSAAQGHADADAAVHVARLIGMPPGFEIFYCVDYDALPNEIAGAIRQYQAAAQATTKVAGYLASVYGSGATCKAFVGAGLAHSGFLAMSPGWSGHLEFQAHASIVQRTTVKVAGFEVDVDDIMNPAVCW